MTFSPFSKHSNVLQKINLLIHLFLNWQIFNVFFLTLQSAIATLEQFAKVLTNIIGQKECFFNQLVLIHKISGIQIIVKELVIRFNRLSDLRSSWQMDGLIIMIRFQINLIELCLAGLEIFQKFQSIDLTEMLIIIGLSQFVK